MKKRTFWQETNFSDWTLFLDRDGVLNERLPDDYVKTWDDWIWRPGVPAAISRLSKLFKFTFIVSNQQGVGKGLMTRADLDLLTNRFLLELRKAGALIDDVYYCTDLEEKPNNCRKPSPAMAYQAKNNFPGIDFNQSIMVGDMQTDIIFGKNLGMRTVQIAGSVDQMMETDFYCAGLSHLSAWITEND